MYKVQRENRRILIEDWNGKLVYSVDEDAYVVYRARPTDQKSRWCRRRASPILSYSPLSPRLSSWRFDFFIVTRRT
jgi:hypothetical protein